MPKMCRWRRQLLEKALRTVIGCCMVAVLAGFGCGSSRDSVDGSGDSRAESADCSLPAPGRVTPPAPGECDYFICSGGSWALVLYCQSKLDAASSSECGNGIVDSGEDCDDGNTNDGAGCSHLCQVEANWTCSNPAQPCIKTSGCGNSDVTSDETCDGGDTLDGEGCALDCLP